MINPEVLKAFSSVYLQNRNDKKMTYLRQELLTANNRSKNYEISVIKQIIKDELNAGKTQREIGEMLNLTSGAITYHVKSLNLIKRNKKWIPKIKKIRTKSEINREKSHGENSKNL